MCFLYQLINFPKEDVVIINYKFYKDFSCDKNVLKHYFRIINYSYYKSLCDWSIKFQYCFDKDSFKQLLYSNFIESKSNSEKSSFKLKCYVLIVKGSIERQLFI